MRHTLASRSSCFWRYRSLNEQTPDHVTALAHAPADRRGHLPVGNFAYAPRLSIRDFGGAVVRRNERTQGGKHQNPFSYILAVVTENREPEHYVVARRRIKHPKGPKLIGIKGVTLRQTVAIPDREESALGPANGLGLPVPSNNQIGSLPVQL
jgi:hypothetical protein